MFMQHVGAEDRQLLLPRPFTCGSLCPPPLLSQPPSTTVSDVRTRTEVSIIDAHRVALWVKGGLRQAEGVVGEEAGSGSCVLS